MSVTFFDTVCCIREIGVLLISECDKSIEHAPCLKIDPFKEIMLKPQKKNPKTIIRPFHNSCSNAPLLSKMINFGEVLVGR